MHFSSSTLAIGALALATSVSAKNYLGFNSGSTKDDGTAKFKADFVAEFKTAKNLQNAPGDFSAVRLYTNLQQGSKVDPIEAFEAAIETNTSMLLGIWASGTTSISGEITALKKAVTTHGSKFTDLVIGISIGSEDLYRDSVTGKANEAGIGASPDTILSFIKDFRSSFANTPLASKPVGHVDTWDVWPNATIKAVIDAVDFIGVNEFPYYESGKGNSIKNSGKLFDTAYETVLSIAGDKPVWLTETGWPYVGETWDEAEATVSNAQYYWQEVGCRKLFGKTTAFWYTLRDSNPANEMKFAITNNLSTKPRFDLTCPTTFDTPEAVSTSSGSSGTATKATGTATAGSGSSTVVPTGGAAKAAASVSASASASGTAAAGSGAGSVKVLSGSFYAVSAVCAGLFYFL